MPDVAIRRLARGDLAEVDRICRVAFGTFLGLPEPAAFMGDADYVRTRFEADPEAALAAEVEGRVAGSNFATTWGSVGFFGPLSVRPELWDRGVARRLLERTMEIFERRGVRHVGLFTFPHSPKHVSLYQRFGFWPRFLTAVMAKPVTAKQETPDAVTVSPGPDEETALAAVREVVEAVHEGLDLAREVRAVAAQGIGETLLLREGSRTVGVAVCHLGPGSEAGSDTVYVKFGAVVPGPEAPRRFERLLDACERLAAERGMRTIVAGVSLAREEAFRILVARGFRTTIQGVAMHRPNEPGYHRAGRFVVDDWR